jgi:hypothetical protein
MNIKKCLHAVDLISEVFKIIIHIVLHIYKLILNESSINRFLSKEVIFMLFLSSQPFIINKDTK